MEKCREAMALALHVDRLLGKDDLLVFKQRADLNLATKTRAVFKVSNHMAAT